jgi:hypothetical protein
MIYDAFSQESYLPSMFQYIILKKEGMKSSLFFIMSSYFHGGGGPSGVGIEVEFPLVTLPVVLPAIVVPLTVWLSWIVVCASVDIAPKFIDATRPTTNIPTATIVTLNLRLFCMWCYMMQIIYLKITTRLNSDQC